MGTIFEHCSHKLATSNSQLLPGNPSTRNSTNLSGLTREARRCALRKHVEHLTIMCRDCVGLVCFPATQVWLFTQRLVDSGTCKRARPPALPTSMRMCIALTTRHASAPKPHVIRARARHEARCKCNDRRAGEIPKACFAFPHACGAAAADAARVDAVAHATPSFRKRTMRASRRGHGACESGAEAGLTSLFDAICAMLVGSSTAKLRRTPPSGRLSNRGRSSNRRRHGRPRVPRSMSNLPKRQCTSAAPAYPPKERAHVV